MPIRLAVDICFRGDDPACAKALQAGGAVLVVGVCLRRPTCDRSAHGGPLPATDRASLLWYSVAGGRPRLQALFMSLELAFFWFSSRAKARFSFLWMLTRAVASCAG